VLCCSCFLASAVHDFQHKSTTLMSTTMLSISKCCCQFRLSCSLFLTPETLRGKFYKISNFSSMPKKMDHSKETLLFYLWNTPVLFWLNPLPSSVNPCAGMLVPKGMWTGEYDPLKNLDALQGSPSQPQIEVLPLPRKPHISLQSQQWKCNEKVLNRDQTCFCSLLLSPLLQKI